MNLAERVKQRRLELGLSQAELAERAGVAQQSIHKIETGVTQKPRNIIQVAAALKCEPGWLLLGVSNSDYPLDTGTSNEQYIATSLPIKLERASLQNIVIIEEPELSLHSVPVLSDVQAGSWGYVDIPLDKSELKYQTTTKRVSGDAFAMQVTGNSMTNPHGSPSIPAGSIVIVEPHNNPENGKIVVATLNDAPEATIKKLEIDGPQKFLVPLNPTYPTIPINGNCRIVGYVKQVIIDL